MNISELKDNARKLSRELRKKSTEAEKTLWTYLRNRKLNNIKFLRQHRIFFDYENEKRFFIADFYCADKSLIIEVDGEVHLNREEEDAIRENILKNLGYRVIRFNNKEVIENIGGVINKIKVII